MKKIIFHPNEKVRDTAVDSVMLRINHYESRRYWSRIFIHSALVLVTGYSLFPATKLLISNLTDSGFFSYFSLIFSDGTYVTNYIGDLMLTLANSLPITASIIVLGALIIFINSFKKIVELSPDLSPELSLLYQK
jgi:hypothetical protein